MKCSKSSRLNSQLSTLNSQLSSLKRHAQGSEAGSRAFRFTCKLFDFCEDLARTSGPCRTIANQLFDAGSSIGANLEESKAAYSRKELASQNAISLKESRESKYWLRVTQEKSLGRKELREWLLQESDEFVAMQS